MIFRKLAAIGRWIPMLRKIAAVFVTAMVLNVKPPAAFMIKMTVLDTRKLLLFRLARKTLKSKRLGTARIISASVYHIPTSTS